MFLVYISFFRPLRHIVVPVLRRYLFFLISEFMSEFSGRGNMLIVRGKFTSLEELFLFSFFPLLCFYESVFCVKILPIYQTDAYTLLQIKKIVLRKIQTNIKQTELNYTHTQRHKGTKDRSQVNFTVHHTQTHIHTRANSHRLFKGENN